MSDYELSYVIESGGKDSNDDGNDIDQSLLEKRLEGLRDTQESVQGLSLWCRANKRHSQQITDTWLKILRKSPVEKRLTMFYLANDVVQHAKRKSDMTVVNQWAFAVQKATPHVRAPSSVSTAISRIFKIWAERGIYSRETVADLLSLLNNSSKDKVEKKGPETYTASADKVASFQPSQLISKIKLTSRLKSHLGTTFRTKSYCQMSPETLKTSIKDRQHGQEVIQEMGGLLEQLRTSEMKLQNEVEERRKIREVGEIAIVFYENIRSESKIVNAAYKNFTSRVLKAKDVVEAKLKSFEEMEKEPSPCPSPPAAAPSPDDNEDAFAKEMMSSTPTGFNSAEVLQAAASANLFESTLRSEYPESSSMVTNFDPDYHPMDEIPMPPASEHPEPPPPVASNPFDSMAANMHMQNMQNWSALMMNYVQPAVQPVMPNVNFISPAVQLQLQMQQQHIQAFGFPPDLSPAAVPGGLPGPPPSMHPPPPPEELNPYPPPPPQPADNASMPDSLLYGDPPPPPPPPVIPLNEQMPMHAYPDDHSSRPGSNFMTDDHDFGRMEDFSHGGGPPPNFDFRGQAHPQDDQRYSGHVPESEAPFGTPISPPDFHSPVMRKNSYEACHEIPMHHESNADFGFNQSFEEEPRNFVQDQYSPQKTHPFSPSQRGKRGQQRPLVQRTLQPLAQAGPPLYKSRGQGSHTRQLRPPPENHANPNTIPLGKPIHTPSNNASNASHNRVNPFLSLAGYPTEDNPTFGGANHGVNGNTPGQFSADRPLHSPGSAGNNTIDNNQGPMGASYSGHRHGRARGNGFRGSFNSPRGRGVRPSGPRRGRY